MTSMSVSTPPAKAAIPPLQSGDRLTVEEFHRRYEAMPRSVKAELIKGVVYMPSPANMDLHAVPHAELIGWLFCYRAGTPGVRVADNSTLRELEDESEPQPDASLRILPEFGGRTRTDPKGYMEGAPELIAEIAWSSASYDLHDKMDTYRINGALEYVVWRTWDEAIDWFVLRGDRYERLPVSAPGSHHSEVFPGLWLDAAALLRGDAARVIEVLQQGLASPEHAAFVQRLQQQQAAALKSAKAQP